MNMPRVPPVVQYENLCHFVPCPSTWSVMFVYFISESKGQLEAEEGTYTSHITQTAIRNAVDITTAAKGFDLKLDQFGPYK